MNIKFFLNKWLQNKYQMKRELIRRMPMKTVLKGSFTCTIASRDIRHQTLMVVCVNNKSINNHELCTRYHWCRWLIEWRRRVLAEEAMVGGEDGRRVVKWVSRWKAKGGAEVRFMEESDRWFSRRIWRRWKVDDGSYDLAGVFTSKEGCARVGGSFWRWGVNARRWGKYCEGLLFFFFFRSSGVSSCVIGERLEVSSLCFFLFVFFVSFTVAITKRAFFLFPFFSHNLFRERLYYWSPPFLTWPLAFQDVASCLLFEMATENGPLLSFIHFPFYRWREQKSDTWSLCEGRSRCFIFYFFIFFT